MSKKTSKCTKAETSKGEEEYEFVISDYSEKSLKVEGEATKSFIPEWKSVGGRFNRNLKGGPGWIFPKTKETELLNIIEKIRNGDTAPSDPIKSSTKGLIDKISRDMQNLSPEDRLEMREYIKSTFYFE